MKIKNTKMKHFIALPDFVSLCNMSSGFLSVICSIDKNLNLAALFIILAIIFDSCDGWTARKINRNDVYGFGKNIDSLSDIISFGIAPAIFLIMSGIKYPEIKILLIIVGLFMVICGVLRLTRYNIISDKIEFQGFIGFPIPGIAFILVSFYLSGLYNIYISIVLMVITAILMISNIEYKKLDNIKLIGISFILVILMLLHTITIYNVNIPGIILLIIVLYYLISNIF